MVESIRALRLARSGAVKARTAAINSLKGLLVTAPAPLRESLAGKPTTAPSDRLRGYASGDDLTDAGSGVKAAP